MNRDDLSRWVDAYEAAWRGGEGVDQLFKADATYRSAPFLDPYRGIDAIEEFWRRETAPGEEFTMRWEIVAVEGDTGVVSLDVEYSAPERHVYKDLWVVTLDADGRCTAFEEWPFWPPGESGSHAPGPE